MRPVEVAASFECGLLINAARPNVLRLMPALDVSNEHIAELRELLVKALAQAP